MTRDWYSLLSFLVLFSLGYVTLYICWKKKIYIYIQSRDSFSKFIINLIAALFISVLKLFIML